VLPQLADGKPYALVGTSAGAGLLLRAMLDHPDPLLRGVMVRVPLTAASDLPRDVPDATLPGWVSQQRTDKARQLWGPAQARVSPHVHALREDPSRYHLELPPGTIEVPGLVLAGRQDTRVGFTGAVSLANVMPRATLAVIDGAEHDYPYDDIEVFVALVEDWLRRVSAEWTP
jgi:pimeloyl-ACP methyl ester carboxylesterase